MRVGILSDTHDRTAALSTALDLFRGRQVDHYVHCGDVGGTVVLDLLAGLPVTIVWGNNDYDVTSLGAYARDLGIEVAGRHTEIELGGRLFAVMHGDDAALKRTALQSGRFDYLLQGHTHVFTDERHGRTRLINPGALHRAVPKTVALLDTATDHLERIVISA